MNEIEIQERLKQNIPQPDRQDATPIEDPKGHIGDGALEGVDIEDTMTMYRLYDYFEVEPPYRNGGTEEQIRYIYQWAAIVAGKSDYVSVATKIREIEHATGNFYREKNRLNRLYEYAKLDSQRRRIEAEIGLL